MGRPARANRNHAVKINLGSAAPGPRSSLRTRALRAGVTGDPG